MYRLYWCLPTEQGGQYLLSTHSTEEQAEEAAAAFGASLPGVIPMVEIVREEVTV